MRTVPPHLEIIGRGVVFPGGLGVDCLANCFPKEPELEKTLATPHQSFPVRKINLNWDKLARWRSEARLRRASPLAFYLAEAANQAMSSLGDIPLERVGLVCALGTGSINFSRKFYQGILSRGRHFASPALFPETVYNSPTSHIAALLNIKGACTTVVGDETAWVDALRVAQVWLACHTVEAVLVLAGEELDPIALDAFVCAGWFRRGMVASEGAAAVLVRQSSESTIGRVRIPDYSVSFRSPEEQRMAWEKVIGAQEAGIETFLPSNIHPADLCEKYPTTQGLSRLGPDWGSAFTASTAWGFLQAYDERMEGSPFHLLIPGSTACVTALTFL